MDEATTRLAGSEASPPGSWPDRALLAFPAVALALGILLRVALLWRKPFWADEAWVALFVQEPVGELLATLRTTTAPAGFALVVKLCSLVPGIPPEIALRLLPLLAGVATVALLPRLVRALGGSPRAAAIAAALAAAMPALVHYSRELKPYALDAFFATAFPLAALRLFSGGSAGGSPPGRAARYLPAALAVATPLFCFGGVFPVAATILWGWLHLLRRGPSAVRLPWAAATAPFLLVSALLGALLLVPQASNPLLHRYFKVGGQGALPHPLAAAKSLGRLLTTAARHQFPHWHRLALATAAAGLLAWPAPGRAAATVIAGGSAILAAAVASAGLYLVDTSRLLLFTAPFLIAAVSVGLDRPLALLARRPSWRGGASLAALLLAGGVAAAWSTATLTHYLWPEETTRRRTFLQDSFRDVPGIVDETIRLRRPDEPVLVGHVLGQSFRYYERGRIPGAAFLRGKRPARRRASLAAWLPTVSARGWVLLGRGEATPGLRATIARRGYAIREERRFLGAVLWEVTREGGGP